MVARWRWGGHSSLFPSPGSGEAGRVSAVGAHTHSSPRARRGQKNTQRSCRHKQDQKPRLVSFSSSSGWKAVSGQMNIMYTYLCVQGASPQSLAQVRPAHGWLLDPRSPPAAGTWACEPPGPAARLQLLVQSQLVIRGKCLYNRAS